MIVAIRKRRPRKQVADFRYFPCPKIPFETGEIWRLKEKERSVFLYICFKLYGFNKHEDEIAYEQMKDGLTDAKGNLIQAGLGYSRSTLKRAIAGLKKNGWIRVRRNGRKPNIISLGNLRSAS